MPTPTEIIESFRKNQPTDSLEARKQTEVMVEGLRDLLEETDPKLAAQKAYDLLRTHEGASPFGTAVCQAVLLKPEGVKMATEVGRQMGRFMATRVKSPQEIDGFLRNDSAISNFTKEFITQTSPSFANSVVGKGTQIAQKYHLDSLSKATPEEREQAVIGMAKEMKALMTDISGLRPETKQYLQGLHAGITSDPDFVGRYAHQNQATEEQALAMQNRLGEIAINNSIALRFVTPNLRDHPQLKDTPAWTYSSSLAQKSFNANDKDTFKVLGSDLRLLLKGQKTQDQDSKVRKELLDRRNQLGKEISELQKKEPQTSKTTGTILRLQEELQKVVEQNNQLNQVMESAENELNLRVSESIHDEQGREGVREMMKSLKETPPSPRLDVNMSRSFNESAKVRKVVQQQRTEIAETRVAHWQLQEGMRSENEKLVKEKAGPELKELARLETKLNALQKPSMTKRFTALFKGGIDKLREKTIQDIDRTKLQILAKTDPEAFNQLQKQNLDSMNKLRQERIQLTPSVEKAPQQYAEAQKSLQETESVLDFVKNAKPETQQKLQEQGITAGLQQERQKSVEQMLAAKEVLDTDQRLGQEIRGLYKNHTVGDTLKKEHVHHDEHHDHQQGAHVGEPHPVRHVGG